MSINKAHEIARLSAENLLRRLAKRDDSSDLHAFYKRIFDDVIYDNVTEKFAEAAIAAAKNGLMHIPVDENSYDKSWLKTIGLDTFIVTKRAPYESWLSGSLEKNKVELHQWADQLLVACPSLRSVGDAGIFHRNPIVSMMQTMWLDNEIKTEVDTEKLIKRVCKSPNVSCESIRSNISHFEIVLNQFLRVKALEIEYLEVARLNSFVPAGSTSCEVVRWDLSNENLGANFRFSADVLQWYSKNWSLISNFLNQRLQTAADFGKFTVDLEMSFIEGEWRIDDSLAFTLECGSQMRACSPIILADELERSGYSCEILHWSSDTEVFEVQVSSKHLETPIPDDTTNGYTLRVYWAKNVVEEIHEPSDQSID